MSRLIVFSVLALAGALWGCGGSTIRAPGAGTDALPSDATSIGTCDPVKQDCPSGQTCDLVCEGLRSVIACRPLPAGGGQVGATCANDQPCGARSGCFATAGVPSQCIGYCATDADCAGGTTCQTRQVTRNCGENALFKLRFCLPQPGAERDAGAIVEGVLKITPTSNDFGARAVGQTSAPVPFAVSNSGTGLTGIPEATVVGDFSISRQGCTTGLAPRAVCLIEVVFRPSQPGTRNGTLTVRLPAGEAVTASLSGTGGLPDASAD